MAWYETSAIRGRRPRDSSAVKWGCKRWASVRAKIEANCAFALGTTVVGVLFPSILLIFSAALTGSILAYMQFIYSSWDTFGLVFSVPTEHNRGPRTSHIQTWAYPPPHPHQNYYCLRKFWSYSDHMAQRFQFVCRFMKILNCPLLTLYKLPQQLLYLSLTFWS